MLLAGRVCALATHGGIASTARCSRARYALGVTPTSSVNRELNEPREVQPTSMHASVTLMPARSSAIAALAPAMARCTPRLRRERREKCPGT